MQLWRRRGTTYLALGILALAGVAALQLALAPEVPAQSTVPEGHIVVEGRLIYIPRDSGKNLPASGLQVDIYDLDEGFPTASQLLASTTTDARGFFRSPPILNVDPDGPAGQTEKTQDVFLRLRSDAGDVKLLELGSRRGYNWNSYDINQSTGLLRNVPDGIVPMQPLYIEENTRDVDALWTYIDLSRARFFMEQHTGEDPGEITALWSPTSNQGPEYDPAEREIILRSDSSGYGDVVVQQAVYAIVHNMLGSLPTEWEGCTAGPGAEMQESGSQACALIQGLATFVALGVFEDPNFDSAATQGLAIDAATYGSAGWDDGDDVPGRVAGAFWDLFELDETNTPAEDGTDGYNATFGEVWQIFADAQPITMEAWWQGWLAAGMDGCAPLGSLKQNTIDYNTDPVIDTSMTTIILDEDETVEIDLSSMVSDVECAGEQLQFAMIDPGDPNAGARFTAPVTLTIEPKENWFGQTTVRMTASDGATALPLDLTVIVNSVNDCPTIEPRVSDPPAERWGDPIVIDLAGRADDVEDQPQELTWSVEIAPQNQGDFTATVQGDQITFELEPTILDRYTALVMIQLSDRDGCTTEQPLKLIWDSRPNQPPFIRPNTLPPEIIDCQGSTINLDLEGVGGDDEDGPDPLEWFCDNCPLQGIIVEPRLPGRQGFTFIPEPETTGSHRVDLRVVDSGGLSARATITLTWRTEAECSNLPPLILRNKMFNKTAGLNAEICYDLRGKATDPDHPDSSLTWWMDDVVPNEMVVSGEGSKQLCLRPNPRTRPNYEGCFTTTFVVLDPLNASDSMPIQTCWRDISIHFPTILQQRR